MIDTFELLSAAHHDMASTLQGKIHSPVGVVPVVAAVNIPLLPPATPRTRLLLQHLLLLHTDPPAPQRYPPAPLPLMHRRCCRTRRIPASTLQGVTRSSAADLRQRFTLREYEYERMFG